MSFNQDSSCFTCPRENGFIVYNCDPCAERFNRTSDEADSPGSIGIVKMVNRSNIFAIVGGGKNPKYPKNSVMIWDDFQFKVIADLEFKSNVTGLSLTKDYILVTIADKAYFYKFNDLELLETFDTVQNLKGVCALTKNIIAVPGNAIGSVIVKAEKQYIISAHATPIAKIVLSPDGKLLATASERGTLIRVWDVETGSLLRELRRGLEVVEIHSLVFNNDGSRLLVSSEKGTVHIFSLLNSVTNKKSNFSYISDYLPSYFASEWSFLTFEVPSGSSCTFGKVSDTVYAVTSTNRFLRFTYNTANGTADCVESVELERLGK